MVYTKKIKTRLRRQIRISRLFMLETELSHSNIKIHEKNIRSRTFPAIEVTTSTVPIFYFVCSTIFYTRYIRFSIIAKHIRNHQDVNRM